MFGTLTPWKRKSPESKLSVRQDHPVAQLREEFDQLWDRMLGGFGPLSDLGPLSLSDESRWLGPRVEFNDEENQYVLRAEVPGFEPGDFDVKISGNVLTVRAEHKEEKREGDGGFRRYGSFCESFTLPQGVREDQIDARYHSGVLELCMPKSEESRGRRIEVKSA
jgi:HSP20 family protein